MSLWLILTAQAVEDSGMPVLGVQNIAPDAHQAPARRLPDALIGRLQYYKGI